MLLWNMLLAAIWAMLTGDFTLRNFAFGFALGFTVLYVSRHGTGHAPRYVPSLGALGGLGRTARRALHAVSFVLFFLWELILANLRVAWEVVTPGLHMRPGIVAIPLDARTDAEITLLANVITLTPGTMSVDVSTDRRVLYIHAMYVDDPDALRRNIKNGFERRLLEVMR
jgi:multicomponent Na+:H+ antiporter subunit E